jgi:DNA-binding response OmpR family regulator
MNGRKILVVDDERFFREAINDALRGVDIEAVLAGNGESGLELAADPDVGAVVLDLQLPDLHGLEVFRRLKELRSDLPVIILSAHTDQDSVLEALRLGAFDYLAKPLHEEELTLAVGRALESHSLASGWSRLRSRIGRLEHALGEIAARAAERGGLPPEALYQAATQAAAEVLGAGKTSLMLLDEAAAELHVGAVHGRKVEPEAMDRVPVGDGVAGLALARAQPILVDDVAGDERFPDRRAEGRYDSGSFAVTPLRAGGRGLGVLCASDPTDGDTFDAEDLALLRILGVQIAGLLEGPPAPPAPDEEDPVWGGRPEAAELARRVCEAVTAEVEPARILAAALDPIADALGAAPVSIYLLDAARGVLVREAECDGGRRSDRGELPAAAGLTGSVLSTGQIVATGDPREDPRFDPESDTPRDGEAGPLVMGALRFRGKSLGVFRIFPTNPDDAAPDLTEVLAAALSAAVRNVLLYRSLVASIEQVAEARRGGRGDNPTES